MTFNPNTCRSMEDALRGLTIEVLRLSRSGQGGDIADVISACIEVNRRISEGETVNTHRAKEVMGHDYDPPGRGWDWYNHFEDRLITAVLGYHAASITGGANIQKHICSNDMIDAVRFYNENKGK